MIDDIDESEAMFMNKPVAGIAVVSNDPDKQTAQKYDIYSWNAH